ncbi:MAG TPA: hypothetical protein VFL93_13120 [Longimicrobiaceae bacterium]|nr:hypothetical protein [Longimicrobiaceae bacterium]
MGTNRQAYQVAYQRALQNKFGRGLWAMLTSIFEDEYTRRSREQGERDGTRDRLAAVTEQTPG